MFGALCGRGLSGFGRRPDPVPLGLGQGLVRRLGPEPEPELDPPRVPPPPELGRKLRRVLRRGRSCSSG